MKKVFLLFCISILAFNSNLWSQDLLNHIHTGYQGWFTCKGDESDLNNWIHWGSNSKPLNNETVTVDFFPDLREYNQDKLYKAPFFSYQDGSDVKLFSSNDYETVDLHFKWMKKYGIDGVFLQRFLSSLKNSKIKAHRDKVLEHVIKASKKYNRKFAIMYDLSGYDKYESKRNKADFQEFINNDWTELNKKYMLTKSTAYMHENNKPVLAVWGLGFSDRSQTLRYAKDILNTFKGDDKPYSHNTYLIAGVPSYWRTLSRDSEKNPEWTKTYRSFDMISPWSVTRYRDTISYKKFTNTVTTPDIIETKSKDIDYMPVIFPGFSWGNLKKEEYNTIPRNGGKFLWNQVYESKKVGAKCIYFAMFDEVDEGTAIFKLAENQNQVPKQGKFVSLDADGLKLPCDWYLKIARETGKVFRDGKEVKKELPMKTKKYQR